MAIPFFIEKRKLVPNWRSFVETTALGELASGHREVKQINKTLLIERIGQWSFQPDIVNAAELLNTALILNQCDNNEVVNAAEFITQNHNRASKSLLSLATKFNKIAETRAISSKVFNAYEEFKSIQDSTRNYSKIASLKNKLRNFPKNPILWVELSRHYSVLGQLAEAKRSMRVANALSPDNRFILRCLANLFVQTGDLDVAHDHLRKSKITSTDPWITSAEIALAGLRDRRSRFVDKALTMLKSSNLTAFSITELTSGVATLELENGKLKNARNLFKKSLISPNDNSLAQVEWASLEERDLKISIPKNLFERSYEALAYNCYDRNDWGATVENCLRWFIDMPTSKTSMLVAFHVATIFMKDYELALQFCNAALNSHPSDPTLLNNRAYAQSFLKMTPEAFEDIKRAEASPDLSLMDKICLTATRGLAYYRQGDFSEGRVLYLQAMEMAKKANEKYWFNMALLNFAREEILADTVEANSIYNQIEKLAIDPVFKDLVFLQSEILKLKSRKRTGIFTIKK